MSPGRVCNCKHVALHCMHRGDEYLYAFFVPNGRSTGDVMCDHAHSHRRVQHTYANTKSIVSIVNAHGFVFSVKPGVCYRYIEKFCSCYASSIIIEVHWHNVSARKKSVL